ncbi:AAA family ATPase [Thermodesulfobacteriota bacterium]
MEHKINLIRIAGFRRLRELELPVRPFMALIGANGVGKTSFLDALSLLSASASGNLNNTMSRLGGIANLLEAVNQCAELKAFVNTILSLSGGTTVRR